MTLEQRVTPTEESIKHIMALQGTTLEFIREVRQSQVKQQEQIDRLEQRMDQFEKHMKSMDRFNRQTRHLWIKIAQKVDWLDEDDWPEDEV